MTFCASVKTEIISLPRESSCCLGAHLYGMLIFSRVFSPSRITLGSEYPFVIEHLRHCLGEYGIQKEFVTVEKLTRGFALQITDKATLERIFYDFGYTGDEPNLRIIKQNFLCENCIASFIAGCFMTAGNLTDPGKGYHLEFTSRKAKLFSDLFEILHSAGFDPHQTTRGNARILYFKNSTQIEDILTWIGAVHASLDMMNTKIYKDIKNSVNRRTNCENANIDKTVISASRDRDAIETIYQLRGEGWMPKDLRQIASIRLANPELSLAELGELLDKPLSKSGVNHRLRRIRAEAQNLKQQ